jgi:polyisoprenoid-binding protein YceI
MRFDASNADCVVLTFVEGALSAMGHDLEIRAGAFQIEVDDAREHLRATFDPASLEVAHALKNGRPAAAELSANDRRKIAKNIRDDVLQPARYPEIRFDSERIEPGAERFRVSGRLTLHGATRPLAFEVVEREGRYEAEARVHQPDFGIRPYRAPLGVLKVKPGVVVRVVTR